MPDSHIAALAAATSVADRWAILNAAIFMAGIYASLRVGLAVVYPVLAGWLWQYVLGPPLARTWPLLGQNSDRDRMSFLDLGNGRGRTVVWRWTVARPPVRDLANGLRDGFLFGLIAALMPEVIGIGLALVAVVVLIPGAWRIAQAREAWITDEAFRLLHDFLAWWSLVIALQAVQ